MEVVERFWQDGNIEATLGEIRQILGREGGSTPNTDALLLFAEICYQLGNVHYAAELLNRVKFHQFDLKQWIVENNLLVLKYLRPNKRLEDRKTVASSFGALLEKLGGLPFNNVQLLSLNVCLNYVLVLFCSNTQRLLPGGYNVTKTVLYKTLERVCSNPDESYQGFSQVVQENLRVYFQEKRAVLNGQELKQEEILVASLVWILASNLLINSQVTEAQSLIKIVLDTYEPTKRIDIKKTDLIFTLMADAQKSQDFLIPSCHLVQCYASFILKNKTLSVRHCDLCLKMHPEFVSGLFLKGILLYESGKYDDAVPYFQKVVTLSNENGYKATALNVLGCICAKLGKPHTALLKFRESFASHSGHLEALYNVAVVYHDAGDLDLEISMWKYILKILSLPKAWNVPDTTGKINVDYVCGTTVQALGDSISEDHFFISTDIYCVQRCDIKSSKLCLSAVLFKIAHNCLILKRYSEASEFYGKLLVQLSDRPVDLRKCGIASLPTAYKEFAEALLKYGRYEDCLVVCEKMLNQETASNKLFETISSQDGEKFCKRKALIEIMLCKATVLKELRRPVEANECYEGILNAMNANFKTKSCTVECDVDEPKHKRQKSEMDVTETLECKPHENFEEAQNLKALTLNNQGLLLSSLGRTKEALLLLAQSISCQPDCIKYRYNHTRLLFDMGMEDEAAKDWSNFRKIFGSPTTESENFILNDLPSDDEDRNLYINMDTLVLSRLSRRS